MRDGPPWIQASPDSQKPIVVGLELKSVSVGNKPSTSLCGKIIIGVLLHDTTQSTSV